MSLRASSNRPLCDSLPNDGVVATGGEDDTLFPGADSLGLFRGLLRDRWDDSSVDTLLPRGEQEAVSTDADRLSGGGGTGRRGDEVGDTPLRGLVGSNLGNDDDKATGGDEADVGEAARGALARSLSCTARKGASMLRSRATSSSLSKHVATRRNTAAKTPVVVLWSRQPSPYSTRRSARALLASLLEPVRVSMITNRDEVMSTTTHERQTKFLAKKKKVCSNLSFHQQNGLFVVAVFGGC